MVEPLITHRQTTIIIRNHPLLLSKNIPGMFQGVKKGTIYMYAYGLSNELPLRGSSLVVRDHLFDVRH